MPPTSVNDNTRSMLEKSPPIKIDLKKFSGEPEDWITWSKVHRDQLSALGCADALTETAGDETKVNRDDFDRGSVDPDELHKAQQAWVSLVTSFKGVEFDIVNAEESASEAWTKLVQHYQTSGLKERRGLAIDFCMMKMELGEHPRKFLLRVDQMVKELERMDRPVDPKDIDIVILNGLAPQYDAEVRMLESSSDWPTWEWIERAVINQYERLESEKSATGSRTMLSARGHRRNNNPPSDAHFAPAQDTLPCNAVNSRSPAVRRNRTDIGGMENMAVTAETAETAEVAEMAEAAKAAEYGNRGGGGSKNRGGGGGKQKRCSKDSESGDKTACSDCYFCLELHKASECPNRSASATAPATPNSQHGVFLGSVRTNLGAGSLVATNTRPALAARGAPRERHENEY